MVRVLLSVPGRLLQTRPSLHCCWQSGRHMWFGGGWPQPERVHDVQRKLCTRYRGLTCRHNRVRRLHTVAGHCCFDCRG
jgi:hypothetical protein